MTVCFGTCKHCITRVRTEGDICPCGSAHNDDHPKGWCASGCSQNSRKKALITQNICQPSSSKSPSCRSDN